MTTKLGTIQRGEVKRLVFDFSGEMEESETIVGTPTIGVYMKSGVDPNKDAIIVGAPIVDGQSVIWNVRYQIPRVTYYVQCNVFGSMSPLAHTLTGELPTKEFA